MRPTFTHPEVISQHQDGRFAVAITERFDDGALALLVTDMMERNVRVAVVLTAEQVARLSALSLLAR